MAEPSKPTEPQNEPLLEWVTPELIVEKVSALTEGGGTPPVFIDPETGTGNDPEFYAS